MSEKQIDSELWLFFNKECKVDDSHVILMLENMETSVSLTISHICLHRTFSNAKFPNVVCWRTSEDVNPAPDELVAVSMRLSHNSKDVFRDEIQWTLTFVIKYGVNFQSQTTTFITGQGLEEGLSNIQIKDDDRNIANIPFRYLIIWDTVAPPAPGLKKVDRETRHKSWLNDAKSEFPLWVGHRGMGAHNCSFNPGEHLGDNTLSAFNAAVDIGADMIELDVQLSQDDVLIVHHDFIMKESDDGKLLFRDLKQSEIKQLCPDIPTLSDVFNKVDRRLGIDVEVKYPMLLMNGLLETDEKEEMLYCDVHVGGIKEPRWPKNKFADIVLKAIKLEAHNRRLFLSTFHPDIALILSRKIATIQKTYIPVIGLTRGETYTDVIPEKFHADMRNKSVLSASSWARAVDLDGVAPFAASAFTLSDPPSVFGDDLSAFLWGRGLNSEEVLKKYKQQRWVSGLIVDNMDKFLPLVKCS